jgi:hypothetical protein
MIGIRSLLNSNKSFAETFSQTGLETFNCFSPIFCLVVIKMLFWLNENPSFLKFGRLSFVSPKSEF